MFATPVNVAQTDESGALGAALCAGPGRQRLVASPAVSLRGGVAGSRQDYRPVAGSRAPL